MQKRYISRWRAAAIHLTLSAVVVALVFSLIYFVWYPGPLFQTFGGRDLFLLIATVDLSIGPLITLIIFRQGKKGLRFDLTVIAVLQVAALAYGSTALYESRPVWIVFVKDRFELVRANQIIESERVKAKPPYDELSLTGPRLVGARLPTNPDEQLQLALTAAAGQDVQTYPKYLIPYDDVRGQVKERAMPISRLRKLNPDAGATIDRLIAKLDRKEVGLGFIPMRAGKKDLAVFVDRATGEKLATAELNPWGN
jgi:hypothetical protein